VASSEYRVLLTLWFSVFLSVGWFSASLGSVYCCPVFLVSIVWFFDWPPFQAFLTGFPKNVIIPGAGRRKHHFASQRQRFLSE
jgi:hypothetical protein